MQLCLTAEINIQLTVGMSQPTTFLEINFNKNSFSFATDALNLSLLVLKNHETTADLKPYLPITLVLISTYKLLDEVKSRIHLVFRIYELFERAQLTLFCSHH